MPISRRKFIKIIGGGAIVAASAGTGVFLTTRTPEKAMEPWQQAGSFSEPRLRALSYAILSPNSHNMQPWLVDLSQKDKVVLYVDTKRMLPKTDPFNRQITIGMGCFLETLRIAAAQDGHHVSIQEFPDGYDDTNLDKRPIALITFFEDKMVKTDPLFSQILNRRSLKTPYDINKKIPTEVLQDLTAVVGGGVQVGTTNNPAMVNQLRMLTHEAMDVEMKTPRTYKESVDLFRIGKAEINANPDGIHLGGPLIDSLAKVGLFTREAALDTESSAYQQGIDFEMSKIDTAMGYVWLTTKTNTRLDQLNAGRDWVRVNLLATQKSLGLHPISQALQEFDEMKTSFDAIHTMLEAKGGTVQMFGRLGYAAKTPPTPRWPLAAKMLAS